MITKRAVIVALVGLNLFLLAAMILSGYSLPSAYAQRAGASGNYIAATCRADDDFDVLYLLDLYGLKLNCFVPDRNIANGTVHFAGTRDLAEDFNR